jgi:hypothetical protein
VLARLRYADVSVDWPALAAAYPMLDARACLEDMHLVFGDAGAPPSSIETGFDAYRSIAWVLPIAWPVLPLLYLPGVPVLGRRIYRFVAFHRSTTSCLAEHAKM